VDIEIEAGKELQQAIIKKAHEHACKVIISYHNYDETPGLKDLYKIVDECYALGADVAKLATLSKSDADNARILSLFSTNKPLVALGMGDIGKLTRIVTPLLGAEFTFAAMDDGTGTAPGQMTYSAMKSVLELLKEKL
jgi:3-dehydroquinate dehydratase-1